MGLGWDNRKIEQICSGSALPKYHIFLACIRVFLGGENEGEATCFSWFFLAQTKTHLTHEEMIIGLVSKMSVNCPITALVLHIFFRLRVRSNFH